MNTTQHKQKYDLATTRLIKKYWDYVSWGEDPEGFTGIVDWLVDEESAEEPDFVQALDDEVRRQIDSLHGLLRNGAPRYDWINVPNGKGGFKRQRQAVEREHHTLAIDAVILEYGIDAVLDRLATHQALS